MLADVAASMERLSGKGGAKTDEGVGADDVLGKGEALLAVAVEPDGDQRHRRENGERPGPAGGAGGDSIARWAQYRGAADGASASPRTSR